MATLGPEINSNRVDTDKSNEWESMRAYAYNRFAMMMGDLC